MNQELRSKYAEHIAKSVRFIESETRLKLPDDTIIVAKSYSELANFDSILGMDIYVMDMPSDRDSFIAFKSKHTDCYKLQKAWLEFDELYEM